MPRVVFHTNIADSARSYGGGATWAPVQWRARVSAAPQWRARVSGASRGPGAVAGREPERDGAVGGGVHTE